MAETAHPTPLDEDIATIARIEAIPTLLQVISEITGMGLAAVARVHDNIWTLCAVHDSDNFGLVPGSRLDIKSRLCQEYRESRSAVLVEQDARELSRHRVEHIARPHRIQSYMSAPIMLANGEHFGKLCSIDREPNKIGTQHVRNMFTHFAKLIANQLETERERSRTQAQLSAQQEGSSLREQFIAVLGHDLRTPLSAIANTSEMLMRLDDPRVTPLAQRITRNVQRMTGLVNDTMDYARGHLGPGLQGALADEYALGEALESVVQELRDAHPRRTINYHIDIPCPVYCDRRRLQQLASNLLANALAHGAEDRTVVMTANVEGGAVWIEVLNDGAPIPPEHLDSVFTPFWRQPQPGKRDGLGLGLFICSQIVKAHEGELTVTSSADLGTRFVARIPLRPTGALVG